MHLCARTKHGINIKFARSAHDCRPGVVAACLIALLSLATQTAIAQSYPTRPVRLIVPYPAGGPADILARVLGQKLTAKWGQQVVVDNRAGANTIIGMELTARLSTT